MTLALEFAPAPPVQSERLVAFEGGFEQHPLHPPLLPQSRLMSSLFEPWQAQGGQEEQEEQKNATEQEMQGRESVLPSWVKGAHSGNVLHSWGWPCELWVVSFPPSSALRQQLVAQECVHRCAGVS